MYSSVILKEVIEKHWGYPEIKILIRQYYRLITALIFAVVQLFAPLFLVLMLNF